MYKKYLAPLFFVCMLWLISLFIFGESGILDSNYKSKEILRLKAEILRSGLEIDEMTQRYAYLKEMTMPDQNFLVQQGRKLGNIVILKLPADRLSEDISAQEKKKFIVHTIFMAVSFLLIGVLSIIAVAFHTNADFKIEDEL